LTTPAAISLIAVCIAGLFLAIAIAIASIVRIWFGGQTGAAQAFAAIFIACVGLAVPLYYLSHAVTLPRLSDVETTPDEPLDFRMLTTMRPADANPITEPDAASVEAQEEAYPDIGPMALERSAPEVFSLVHEAVERLGWTIALNEAPGETGIGRIEATDRTWSATDDARSIKGDDAHAIIDPFGVRYGLHLGTNAARIRALSSYRGA
jgi:membrane protein implicated in regulation of membrane protease activity